MTKLFIHILEATALLIILAWRVPKHIPTFFKFVILLFSKQSTDSSQKLKDSIVQAFFTVFLTLLSAFLLAHILVNYTSFSTGLLMGIQVASGLFILWAIVGKLGSSIQTWDGQTLPETIDNFWNIFLNVIGIFCLSFAQFYNFFKKGIGIINSIDQSANSTDLNWNFWLLTLPLIIIIIGIIRWLWHLKKIKREGFSLIRKRDKKIDILAKYVTICVFPVIVFTFILNYHQSRLVQREVTLSTHISILQLISQAMWQHNGGSRSSYLILKKMQKDPQLKKTLDLEISNIESSYEGVIVNNFVENLSAVCNSVTTGLPCSEGLATKDNLQIFNLINHLNPKLAPLWIERAKAAYLLRFIKNAKDYDNYKDKMKEVYDELINCMKEENEVSLLVSKMALDTYAQLIDFKPANAFDFEGAIRHKQSIGKNYLLMTQSQK